MPHCAAPERLASARSTREQARRATAHSELVAHVVLQSPRHFTVQADVSLQAIAPPSTWILHVDSALHATVAIAPSLKSQFDIALHVIVLPSHPALAHRRVVARCGQLAHAESKHSVLQSAPAVQLHAVSTHTQPSPVQVGCEVSLPPHATAATAIERSER